MRINCFKKIFAITATKNGILNTEKSTQISRPQPKNPYLLEKNWKLLAEAKYGSSKLSIRASQRVNDFGPELEIGQPKLRNFKKIHNFVSILSTKKTAISPNRTHGGQQRWWSHELKITFLTHGGSIVSGVRRPAGYYLWEGAMGVLLENIRYAFSVKHPIA